MEIPKTVKLSVQGESVHVEGPKGKISFRFHPNVRVTVKDGVLSVQTVGGDKNLQGMQGTARSLIHNMIQGVTDGFSKELAIEGVGFKAQVEGGKKLTMLLGFTHPVIFDIPEGIAVVTPKPTQLVVSGVDKVMVGQFAAKIRAVYEAEPYKGKGIRYVGEVVRRKAGKTVTK